MKVLIVGAGVAGSTLAYWLRRGGHEPTLVERAPQPRAGGYLIDFWGAGYQVAERMGIVPHLENVGYRIREVREVSDTGRMIARLDPQRLVDSVDGRYISIARSDLAQTLFDALGGEVETIFGDSIRSLDDDGRRVAVEFEHAAAREFDLVIGADGLHSRTRGLAFEPDDVTERSLGIVVAVFDVAGYRPRDERVAVTHTEVGLQSLRLALRDGATMFCFTFRSDEQVPQDDVPAQQELLRRRLRGVGWEVPDIVERMPDARTFYMDAVSQIRMPTWSRGRVALVGDAAASPSLLAGQGSALAVVEAYTLAAELHRSGGDHGAAFAAYQRRLGPFVRRKQDAALRLGVAFAPRNRGELLLRNTLMRAMSLPLVADLAMGRSLRDPVELPPPPG